MADVTIRPVTASPLITIGGAAVPGQVARAIAAADRADAAAATAQDAASIALAATNYFPDAAAGEAATLDGELFSYPENGALVLARRTVTGHEVLDVPLPGAVQRINTFASASNKRVPGGTNVVWVEDRRAHFVADAAADAALLAEFPTAVFQSANGRVFRLLDRAAAITAEQFGCAPYMPGVNQQPVLQAALTYAERFGLALHLTQQVYELWRPERVGDEFVAHGIGDGDKDLTGHFLVTRAEVRMAGHPLGTRLWCKGPTGGSLLTDYTTIDWAPLDGLVIWRGCGLYISSLVPINTPDPQTYDVHLERIEFYSDARGVRNREYPSYPPERDPSRVNCWDPSNRGIAFQPDQMHGMLYFNDLTIIGFLGEHLYTGSINFGVAGRTGVIGRNYRSMHGNAQGLNPNGPHVFDIDGAYVEDMSMTFEGWMGYEVGRIVNAQFFNCSLGQIGGSHVYDAPLRADGAVPLAHLDIALNKCGDVQIHSFTRGLIDATDSTIAPTSSGANIPVRDIDLVVRHSVHEVGGRPALLIGKTFTGAMNEPIRSVHVDLHLSRTSFARANAITGAGVGLYNAGGDPVEYGEDVRIVLTGEANGQIAAPVGAYTGFAPTIDVEGLAVLNPAWSGSYDGSAADGPDMAVPVQRVVFSGADGTAETVQLPSIHRVNDGHTITLLHDDFSKQASTLEINGMVTLPYRASATLRADRAMQRWELVRHYGATVGTLVLEPEEFGIMIPAPDPDGVVRFEHPEGQALDIALEANVPGSSFAVSGGPDAALVSVVDNRLLMDAKDYSAPVDANADNTIGFTLAVIHPNGMDVVPAEFVITITDVA